MGHTWSFTLPFPPPSHLLSHFNITSKQYGPMCKRFPRMLIIIDISQVLLPYAKLLLTPIWGNHCLEMCGYHSAVLVKYNFNVKPVLKSYINLFFAVVLFTIIRLVSCNLYVTFWGLPTQYYIAKMDPYGLRYLFYYYKMFHCVSTSQLIYPFFSDGHFGCFQDLSNKNRTVMNFLYMISDEHFQEFSWICSQKWNFLVIVRYANMQLYNIILNHFTNLHFYLQKIRDSSFISLSINLSIGNFLKEW